VLSSRPLRRKPGSPTRVRGAEWAPRKFLQPLTGAVFVLAAQAVDSPQENSFTYGAGVSGATLYNYYRQYDSRTGRYTQADPIGLDGGWNRFGYVDGNPLLGLDPKGLANGAAAQMWMKSPKNQTADVNFQMGLSGNLGAAVMGVGGEVGVATSSRLDDMCVYVQACGVAGPQLVASCGVSYSAGEGLPASGVSTSKGLTWFGGAGVVGAGQVTVNDSGQFQGSRGGVRGQVGAGAGAGYIECTQKMWCARR
jgi:RHS repeat-associated protein